MLTRQTLGIPGLLGAILLIVWAFCFLVLGVHGKLHLLVPIAAFLILMQGVLRVNTED